MVQGEARPLFGFPDIEAKPTIAGLRGGRDEVLEEALRQILGPETPAAEIQKLTPGSK